MKVMEKGEDTPRQKLLERRVGGFRRLGRVSGRGKDESQLVSENVKDEVKRGELLSAPHYLGNVWVLVHTNTFFFLFSSLDQ